MSNLDSCDENNKSMLRHFKLSKNERLSVKALYLTAIVDAVLQILLIGIMAGIWISSFPKRFNQDFLHFEAISWYVLMGYVLCGLQLILALLMVHACAKKTLVFVERSILWIGVHFFFIIISIYIIIYIGYENMEDFVLEILLVYFAFRIIQIVLLLKFRKQILRRHYIKLAVDQSQACNLQPRLIVVGQDNDNDKVLL